MSSRVLSASCGILFLSGCLFPPPPPPRIVPPDEVVLNQCRSLEKDGRLLELAAPYERWVHGCERLFDSGDELESAKGRVRLALDFQADRGLQAGVQPVSWAALAAAVKTDLAALGQATQDGEGLALLARWRMEVQSDRGGALALACKATQVAADLFEAQLLCGDYVRLVRRDMLEAAKRWRTAFPLAGEREEQCLVVDRLRDHSPTADRDLEELSAPLVVADCSRRREEARQEEKDRRQLELADRMRQAAEELQKAADELVKARPPSPTPATADEQK